MVWCQPQDRAKANFIETGIQFMDAPAGYTRDLDKYVTTLAKSNPSTFM